MTVEEFPLSWQPSWKFAVGSSSWNAKIVHTLICTENSIALQSQWYTGSSEFLTRSSDQSDSSQSQPDQKIHFSFQFSSPFSMCMKCWQGLPGASSPSKMYLSYMRLYLVQQFIIFTENVENASLFLSETCFHMLPSTNVVILYKTVWYFKNFGIAGYLPTAWELYDGLSLQFEKFCHGCAVPWSIFWCHGPAFKSFLKL